MIDMKNSSIYPGLAIMLGLIILGLQFPRAVKDFKSYDRTVNVKGLCEREVKADKAIWPIVFKVVGNDLSSVYEEIERKNTAVVDFLTAGGIGKNDISIGTYSISDKYAQEYGSNDRTYRYVAKCTVTACSKDVDKILTLLGNQKDLLKFGIAPENEWDGKPEFEFEGLNDLKPDMIEEATKNAREVALKFAKDSESNLGKIKEATQGTFSISDRDSNTPYIKKVRVVTNVTYYLKK